MNAGAPYVVLAVGSLAWFAPFLLQRRESSAPQKVDRRARWGVVLVGAGYAVPWQTAFWTRPAEGWRVALAAACLALACAFSWTAARALGRHWRIEAGLDADHQLIQAGVYGLVRHPIYTSMLFVVVATSLVLAPLYLLPASVALYVAGTEIRVRAEEALLAERFGEAFQRYRRRVPAYVPLAGSVLGRKARGG
ncbi:MAG TPA: isoprenylcysteine carboxylmethyltransferase family protein [Vicinamibacteria bacterium]|nr:isoprenylcysteine carboxylmethyltransferase family protein [Vicinamibacteria bacterium]